MKCNQSCECKEKIVKRTQKEIKAIDNRINRIIGQLNGVKKMIDENAYCNDVLMQILAISKALKGLSGEILKEHLHSCVIEKIKNEQYDALDEVVELFKKYW